MIISDLKYLETASADVAGGFFNKKSARLDLAVQVNKNETKQTAVGIAKGSAFGKTSVTNTVYADAYNYNETHQSNSN